MRIKCFDNFRRIKHFLMMMFRPKQHNKNGVMSPICGNKNRSTELHEKNTEKLLRWQKVPGNNLFIDLFIYLQLDYVGFVRGKSQILPSRRLSSIRVDTRILSRKKIFIEKQVLTLAASNFLRNYFGA